jgi:hypothetical protein
VVARTPITEDVFRAWRARKVEARRTKKVAEDEERRRKGILTGREIFMQVMCCHACLNVLLLWLQSASVLGLQPQRKQNFSCNVVMT